MKAKSETRPVDVSKGLFMDLAFLLIAALVLLVREPAKEEIPKETAPPIPAVNVPGSSIQTTGIQVDSSLAGQTLIIEIDKVGGLSEVNQENQRSPLELDRIPERLKTVKMPRTIVLWPDREVPYDVVARVREKLTVLQSNNEIHQILESRVHEVQGK